jgi:hypothetical protein
MAMFKQRRSIMKGKLFLIILLALFGFGIWLNAPLDKNTGEEVKTDAGYQAPSAGGLGQKPNGNYDIMDSIIDKSPEATSSAIDTADEKGDVDAQTGSSYYLVKEINGIIMIFYYNEEGKESLIRETNIAFSLLSTSDQKLFEKGVVKNTPEELDELLQDFES